MMLHLVTLVRIVTAPTRDEETSATAKSGFPSRLKSPAAIPMGS